MSKLETAFVLLLLSTLASASVDNKDSSTDLCDNEKGGEFFAQIDGCVTLAKLDFFLQAGDKDVYKTTCDLINARVSCWAKTEAQYNCLTDTHWTNIQEKLLLDEIERAHNNSAVLGDRYIASCSILRTFKTEFLEKKFGSTFCTFNEIKEALDIKKKCEKGVTEKIDFLATFASGEAAWTRVFCIEKEDTLACSETILGCMDAKHRTEQEAINSRNFAKTEVKVQGFGLKNFSYADCQLLTSNRRKRFAQYADALTPEQNQALLNYVKKK